MKKLNCLLTAFLLMVMMPASYAQNIPDSCSIRFESSTTPGSDKTFYAIPAHNQNKRPELICWSFGDGKDTCIYYNPAQTNNYAVHHKYITPGNYNVCVKVKFQGGCESSICKTVTVGEPTNCKVDFEVSPMTSTNRTRKFTAITDAQKRPEKICWNFGDGKDTCIQYSNSNTGPYFVYHTYTNNNTTAEVCIRILYQGGCESKNCKVVLTGASDNCRADFEKINSNSNSIVSYFRASPWHNREKKPARICWIFGDGKDTCIQYPENYTGQYAVSHKYAAAHNYQVCLSILYHGGCESKKCKEITTASPDSCRADFEKISTNSNSIATYFRALPWHNKEKKPARICWIFGDGKDTCIQYPENYSGQYAVSHKYAAAHIYQVCVSILYHGGCQSKKCKEVSIEKIPDACTVNIFESAGSNTNLTRGFYALGSINNDRKIERTCWGFGDGTDNCVMATTSSPGNFIMHTYPAPGVYKTCVKIFFAGGCTAYYCREVIVKNTSNICGGYMTDSLISRLTYKFHGQGISNNNAAMNYYWSFGDGTNITGQNATHTYAQAGQYEVCLTIKTNEGCETHICKKIAVEGSRQSTLELSPNPVIEILHVLFWSNRNEPVAIKILNSNGSVVKSSQKNVSYGSNAWDFNLSGLQAGIYSIVVQSANQQASGIFFKR